MGRIGFKDGVFFNGSAAVIAGAGGIRAVTATDAIGLGLGWAGLALGLGLFVWGVTVDGKDWWRKLPWFRARPLHLQLYISVTQPAHGMKHKMVLVVWDPTRAMLEYRGDAPFVGWPPDSPKEPDIALNLFNAGPDDARHIEVSWSLPDADLEALVQQSQFFGERLDSFNGGRLRLQHDGGGSTSPILTELTAYPTIPLLKSGDTIPITAPTGVTLAWTIAVLATLKINAPDNFAELLAKGMLEFMENLERVPDLRIDVSYFVGTEKRTQRFVMVGWYRPGGSGGAMSREPNKDGAYDLIPGGLTGLIESVQVIRDE